MNRCLFIVLIIAVAMPIGMPVAAAIEYIDEGIAYEQGAGGAGYDYGYVRIVPPPTLIAPMLPRPVSPPPMRIRFIHGRYVAEPDPQFQRMYVPSPPYYATSGREIYDVQYPSYIYVIRRR